MRSSAMTSVSSATKFLSAPGSCSWPAKRRPAERALVQPLHQAYVAQKGRPPGHIAPQGPRDSDGSLDIDRFHEGRGHAVPLLSIGRGAAPRLRCEAAPPAGAAHTVRVVPRYHPAPEDY